MLGPLRAQRARGVEVRIAPWADVADAVGPRTRARRLLARELAQRAVRAARALAVAGRAGAARRRAGRGRGAGRRGRARRATPTRRPGRSGCAARRGRACCIVSAALRERMRPPAPGLREPGGARRRASTRCRGTTRARTTRRRCRPPRSRRRAPRSTCSTTAGWDAIHAHARRARRAPPPTRCASTAARCSTRDRTTLVTWREPDAPAAVERLAEAGVVVRSLPARTSCAPPSAAGAATTISTACSPRCRAELGSCRCAAQLRPHAAWSASQSLHRTPPRVGDAGEVLRAGVGADSRPELRWLIAPAGR